jgi:hypothetical protein
LRLLRRQPSPRRSRWWRRTDRQTDRSPSAATHVCGGAGGLLDGLSGGGGELAQPKHELGEADGAVAVFVPQLEQHMQLAVGQRFQHLQGMPAAANAHVARTHTRMQEPRLAQSPEMDQGLWLRKRIGHMILYPQEAAPRTTARNILCPANRSSCLVQFSESLRSPRPQPNKARPPKRALNI